MQILQLVLFLPMPVSGCWRPCGKSCFGPSISKDVNLQFNSSGSPSQWDHPLKIWQRLVEMPVYRWQYWTRSWRVSWQTHVIATASMEEDARVSLAKRTVWWIWIIDQCLNWLNPDCFIVKMHFPAKSIFWIPVHIDLGIGPTEHSGLYSWVKMCRLSVSEL